jgi:hypothetical protein
MHTLRKPTTITLALALALVLTMGVLAMFKAQADTPALEAGLPSEEGIQPTVIQADNPECADLGTYRPALHDESLKFSPTGTFPRSQTSTDGYLTVTVDNVYNDTYPPDPPNYTGQFFDWHSNRPVDLVIAKGANGADSYAYDLTTVPGPDTYDAHLHAPINASGSYANLSHMDFCYKVRPDVSKTANATFTRTYKWKVGKKVNSVNPNPLTLRTTGLTGATGTANYTVSVDKADPAYVDSDRAVSGTITVTNPLNSGDIVISSINDVVSQGSTNTPVTPTGCSPALPATLGPGDSLTCSYSTPLTSSDAGKNTATAVVSDSNTTPLANGVGSANFAFGDPTKEVDKNVKVTDSYSGGPQNQSVSVGDVSSGPKTFTYNRTIGPYDTCGDQSVKNTATLYGDNDAVLGEASATVTAHVLCNAKVVKTVSSAAPSGSQSFTFELRQGATTMADGTILESKDANAGNGGVINFATGLEPGSTYQICEWVLPGWNTNLTGDGPLFVPGSMTTPSLPNPNVNNMTVCANFTVGAGPTRTFNVDNTPPPGGRALTIGFWKNWASCASSAGKGQKPMLDLALGKASSATTNPPYGLVVSAQNPGAALWPNYASVWYLVLKGNTSSTAPDCAKAVNLLNKTTIDGKKMASDPLFNMTAQLVAAQLNRFMGAGISGVTIINIDRAVLLNGKYKFDGKTYSPKLTTADTNLANCLATQLDNYNNDRPANSCP